MAKKIENCIYILTNPQYPGYVKIGYATDLKQRISSLNTGALVEFSPYAVYETSLQNADTEIHAIIKLLNPILRASKFDNGKAKGKEFFKLEPEEAFELLQHVARVSGTEKSAYRVTADCKPYTEHKTEQSNQAEETEKSNIPPSYDGKPVTIHFLHSDKGSDYRPFKSWADYTSQVVVKAIDEYGLENVKAKVFDKNIKRFHTKKRDTFADNKEAMHGFGCREISDGLWLLTNYSAGDLQAIIHVLEGLFPKAKSELIYVQSQKE